MPCPQVILDLHNTSTVVFDAFMAGYDVLLDERVRQGTPDEELRRSLVRDFSVLESVCYEDYLSGRHVPAIPHQDEWLPILKRIRVCLESFSDSSSLQQVLDRWEYSHQAYRNWLRTCGLGQLSLATFWNALDEDVHVDEI
jgi:hypothetical protein